MQRTSKIMIDDYIKSCKARDQARVYYRDELYNNSVRNCFLMKGLQNLAELFLFNPKKIDKEMRCFKSECAEIKEALYQIANELAMDAKSCRKDILLAIKDIFYNELRGENASNIPFQYLTEVQAFSWAWNLCAQLYMPWQSSASAEDCVISRLNGINLAKCWRQFCTLLLIVDEMSIGPTMIKFGWSSDSDTINNQSWQLLCRVMANTKNIKLAINGMTKVSSNSNLISENKIRELAKAAYFPKKNTVPTLGEFAAYTLFFKFNTQLLTISEIEELKIFRNQGLDRLSITRQ